MTNLSQMRVLLDLYPSRTRPLPSPSLLRLAVSVGKCTKPVGVRCSRVLGVYRHISAGTCHLGTHSNKLTWRIPASQVTLRTPQSSEPLVRIPSPRSRDMSAQDWGVGESHRLIPGSPEEQSTCVTSWTSGWSSNQTSKTRWLLSAELTGKRLRRRSGWRHKNPG